MSNTEFLLSNFHTHTNRCKHAIGSEREFIEAAIKLGVKRLGFSDHVPCPFKSDYVSGIRMDWEQADEYVDCIRTLADEYKDKIQLFVGFEAEYMPEFFEEQCEMYDRLAIDYLILGPHFAGSEETAKYHGWENASVEDLKHYVDNCLEGMATGRYLYLAHPDLFKFIGREQDYVKEMTRLCQGMKELNLPIECNMLGYMEGKHYPSKRFWKIAGEVGGPVVMGLDAHYLHNFDPKAYEYCMNLLKECNITDLQNENLLK